MTINEKGIGVLQNQLVTLFNWKTLLLCVIQQIIENVLYDLKWMSEESKCVTILCKVNNYFVTLLISSTKNLVVRINDLCVSLRCQSISLCFMQPIRKEGGRGQFSTFNNNCLLSSLCKLLDIHLKEKYHSSAEVLILQLTQPITTVYC